MKNVKSLNFEQMVKIHGGHRKGEFKDCIAFGFSFITMFFGPIGILGLLGMVLTAGDCEDYLKSKGLKL